MEVSTIEDGKYRLELQTYDELETCKAALSECISTRRSQFDKRKSDTLPLLADKFANLSFYTIGRRFTKKTINPVVDLYYGQVKDLHDALYLFVDQQDDAIQTLAMRSQRPQWVYYEPGGIADRMRQGGIASELMFKLGSDILGETIVPISDTLD